VASLPIVAPSGYAGTSIKFCHYVGGGEQPLGNDSLEENRTANAAGGLAFASVNEHDVLAGTGISDDNSTTATGWTLGVGADYAFTPNWIGRVEYRYSDFGSFAYSPITFPGFVENHRLTENAILAGLAYKFW
jgi:outer membrane immunogenic protein